MALFKQESKPVRPRSEAGAANLVGMFLGFDIGGTKCSVSIGQETDGKLEILCKRIIPTDTHISPYEMLDKMCELAKELTVQYMQKLCEKETAGEHIDLMEGGKASESMLWNVIGISCGGPLDSKQGVILSPPNLPGWDEIHITEYLQEKYRIPVFLQNDANACAIAEWLYGAGQGCRNMAFLTFGTGMGAGLILDGRLYSGTNDMAGEIGHVRMEPEGPVGYGKAGSFEGFCSGQGIAAMGRQYAADKLRAGDRVSFCIEESKLKEISAKSIAECAKAGHEDALEIYRKCGEKLGAGLAVLIDILNPERIVIGSIFERCEALLRDAMEKKLEEECLSYARKVCRIVPAKLTENIGDYAALSVAMLGLKQCKETAMKERKGK